MSKTKKYNKILAVAKDNGVCTRNTLRVDYVNVRKMLDYESDVVIINVDEGMATADIWSSIELKSAFGGDLVVL